MRKARGKFIVIYGINNLGKTTQAKLLVNNIKKHNKQAEYVKYAHYDLAPSGTLINGYLRQGNPYNLSAREFQILQVLNRTQYQPILEEKLKKGIHIVAEDYIGTGLAWGIGSGVNPEFLKSLNKHLLKEDLAILFTGSQFGTDKEMDHVHETDDKLTSNVANVHLKLAKEFDWKKIDGNRSRSEIEKDIWKIVKNVI